MATFDKKTFDHLKKLCRLETSPEEDGELSQSLDRVLSYIKQLEKADTEGVKPCNFVLRGMLKNRLRSDELPTDPKDLITREQFLSNAPDQIGGMIRVPPVLKDP